MEVMGEKGIGAGSTVVSYVQYRICGEVEVG